MIKLEKSNEPQILIDNYTLWTRAILDKIAAGSSPTETEKTRYRHTDIKSALILETHGKCAYCESKLLHIHHGDVEHIYPKSLDPALTVQWTNLTLACEICNQNKSNKDPYVKFIIDPYATDPKDHLTFAGALALSKGTMYGTNSRAILDLNRGNLVERRQEKLAGLIAIAENILRVDLPQATRQAIYDNFIQNDASDDAPFSAMAASFLEQIRRDLPPDIIA
ncbi:MAG: HNH endonuclease [Stenotrophomonas maltophilia]